MATQWSVIANRKDKRGQKVWTEFRVDAVAAGGCPAQAGALVLLDSCGKIDSSLLPALPSSSCCIELEVNGVKVPDQNVLNFIPQNNIEITYGNAGEVYFNVVGTPSSCATYLCTPSGCAIDVGISAPTHPGMMLISQPGNCSAVWADPQVQGLYPAGSTICPAPAYVEPTCIQPILMGGADCNGVLQNVATTTGGELITLAQDQETDPAVQRFAVTTGVGLFQNSSPSLIPLLSIQPQAGSGSIVLTFRNLEAFGNGQLYHFQLLLNATLTGANFVNVDPESCMTYDQSATSYSGGRLLDAGDVGMVRNRNDYEFVFRFFGSPSAPPTITLVFAPITGGRCASAGCTFAWDEQGGCL